MLIVTKRAVEPLRALALEAKQNIYLDLDANGELSLNYCPKDMFLTQTHLSYPEFRLILSSEVEHYLANAELDFEAEAFNLVFFNNLESRVKAELLRISEVLAQHKGGVTLVKIENDIAYLAFVGSCRGCSFVDNTMQTQVKAQLLAACPELKDVLEYKSKGCGA